MEDFSVRLNKAMEYRHTTAAELAKIIGIAEGTISSYRSGKYKPKQMRLEEIAKALNVSIAYLFGADVEIEPYYTTVAEDEEEKMDEIEKFILDTYRKADARQKMRIGGLISEIADEIEKNHSGTNGNGKVG